MAILGSTIIYGRLTVNDDLYVIGSNGVYFNDTNTQIKKDGDSLSFKDAVAGEYTLQELLVGNPSAQGSKIIESYTEADSPIYITAGENNKIFTNLGAAGAVSFYLPAQAVSGIEFTFAVQTPQILFIYPASGSAIRDDSGQLADKYKWANAVGETITIIADKNGDWGTIAKEGEWTQEA